MFAASFVATGTAGFVAGGATGAAAGVLACTAAWLTWWWRLQRRRVRVVPGAEEQTQASVYADVEDVIDQLDDLARERDWDLPKRLEIARMACENRATPFAELERRYDLGRRSASDNSREAGAPRAKNAE
jgi:hypothetical protein